MEAIVIGAGNIGRGHIAQFLSKAGYHLYFADVNDELIEKLNKEQQYDIQFASGHDDAITIKNVRALHSEKDKNKLINLIEATNLITTAVGPALLQVIAPTLAEGLKNRLSKNDNYINIMACENMVGNSQQLKNYIAKHLTSEEKEQLDKQVGFPNVAIDRIVPNQSPNGLNVRVEPYYEWVVEKQSIKGQIPPVDAFHLVDDLTPYLERKFLTVNTGHATLAYQGNLYECQSIQDAFQHPNVQKVYQGVLDETEYLLQTKHKFTKKEHRDYRKKIDQRFENPNLPDTVKRVGRGPIRKLGPNDRLVRPALELIKLGEKPVYLAKTISALLQFSHEDDAEAKELTKTLNEQGTIAALSYYTGLEKNHPLIEMIIKSEHEGDN